MLEVKVGSLWKLVNFDRDEVPYEYIVRVDKVDDGFVNFSCIVDNGRDECLVGRDDLYLPFHRFEMLYVELVMENV